MSCTDVVWIMPRRFFHCWLCDIYYDIIDDKFTAINIEETMNVSKSALSEAMKEETKHNERFS